MEYTLRVVQWHKWHQPWIVEATSHPKWWQFWAKSETFRCVSEVGVIWFREDTMEKLPYGMRRMLSDFTDKEELRKKLKNPSA